MRRFMLRGSVLTVAGVVAVIAIAAGIGWAAIPDSSGAYTGCYSTTSSPVGRLRVIDPAAGQTCAAGEVQITWNQKGINWKGAWTSTATYRSGDAVVHSGASYIAIAASANHAPPNTTYWDVLAQKGKAGAQGQPGVAYFAKQEVNGPLPQTLSFTGVPAGTAIVNVEGTAYASAVGRYWVTVNLSDAGFCGASSRYPTLYFNQTGVHSVLMPMTWQACLATAGDHTVTLSPSSVNLLTDTNDFFTVSLTVYGSGTTVAAAPPGAKASARPAPGMSPGL
jgi:hypothetical protein